MASTIILSDNGASSGSAGYKITAGNDGVLILQTTTSGGTATNAVYVNNSQNVGFRTTPAAWGSVAKAIQIGARGSLFEYNGTTTDVMNNGYFDGTNYVYLETATAAFHRMATGRHQLYSAASGTAGTTITWTNVLQVEKDYTLALQGGTSSAGTGIAFPPTSIAHSSSNANTLDDYEEGSWTPAFTSTGASFTYPRGQVGRYTKIGNLVYAQFYLGADASGTTSNGIQISGLPFTSNATSLVQGTASAWISKATNLGFTVDSGATTVTLWPQNSGVGATAITSQVAGGYIVGAIIYQT